MTATRTKRILSVQPVCDGGGSEHALIDMVRQLAGHGWDCHVAVPAAARLAREYAAAGATLHVIPMRRLTTSGSPARWIAYVAAWPVTVARLALLARKLGAGVVHSNSLHCWHGWAAAVVARKPHVWHAREIVFQSGLALRVERLLTRRFATVVIAVSTAVAEQLDPSNVEVVTDEPDPVAFNPGLAGRFRVSAGIPDSVPLAGYLGRIDVWKGVDVLLDAFPAVRTARPGAELVIAGGPVPGKEGYAAGLAARAAALEGVHWLGRRGDAGDLMADLDVFVAVSTEPEPFGLVVVEALACGVPVVAGAAGGPLEVVEASMGRLVEPGDPARIADAVASLLPAGPSSTAVRQARKPLRVPAPARFGAVFESALNSH